MMNAQLFFLGLAFLASMGSVQAREQKGMSFEFEKAVEGDWEKVDLSPDQFSSSLREIGVKINNQAKSSSSSDLKDLVEELKAALEGSNDLQAVAQKFCTGGINPGRFHDNEGKFCGEPSLRIFIRYLCLENFSNKEEFKRSKCHTFFELGTINPILPSEEEWRGFLPEYPSDTFEEWRKMLNQKINDELNNKLNSSNSKITSFLKKIQKAIKNAKDQQAMEKALCGSRKGFRARKGQFCNYEDGLWDLIGAACLYKKYRDPENIDAFQQSDCYRRLRNNGYDQKSWNKYLYILN